MSLFSVLFVLVVQINPVPGVRNLQAEVTYVAIFVLVGVFLLLTLLRMLRAAGRTIGQLRYESKRDRLEHKRIREQKYMEFRALNRSSRKIDGKATRVHWDGTGRRARRDFHFDETVGGVFNDMNKFRNMDVRTPWGWPGASGRGISPAGRRPRASMKTRFQVAAGNLFRNKRVVDAEHRARQQRNIRALLEDRYGRAGQHLTSAEIEWSRPALPPELIREREEARIFANMPSQQSRDVDIKAGSLRLVSDEETKAEENRRATGA